MDDKGSSIIEITIVLVIIVLIFGIVVNSTQTANLKISNAVEQQQIETKLSEVIDYLINNPGDYNWVEYKKTPGLAIENENGQTIPNSISYWKFLALGENYKEIMDKKIFNEKIKTSIELIPQESSISSVKIGSNIDGDKIYSVNRFVKCDFYKKYVVKDFLGDGKCNHNHDPSSNSCNYFKIFKGNFKKSDYYLIVDKNEAYKTKYFIDTTTDKSNTWMISEEIVFLNDKINFYNDTSQIVFIHFDKKDAKAVIVSLPKNFDKSKLNYDNFRINNCNLILRANY